MDFSLNSTQEQMVDSVKRAVQGAIVPVLQKHSATEPLPKAAMLKIYGTLSELGLTAPRIPESAGGGGLKMLDYGLLFEQLPPVVAMSLISHEGTVSRIYSGTAPEVRDALLPDLIAGRKIACTANTEQQGGSDARNVKTRLETESGRHYLTGSKMWITNASICDIVNVSCRSSEGTDAVVRVYVDRQKSPFEARETPILGLRQGHLGEMVFDRTPLSSDCLIGEAGDAQKTLTVTWNGNRPLLGLMAVNMAQKAFDAAVEYVGTRTQFGKLLSEHQLVQFDLSEMQTLIQTSRLLCYSALDAIDKGYRANGTSAMAKRYALTACQNAISLSMQVHGAMGISDELGIEQLYRDARVLQVPDGTNGILALIHAREISGRAAFR